MSDVRSTIASLAVPDTSTLVRFYLACDGIELPDVDVGYFLYSLDELASVNRMISEPRQVGAEPIIVLGVDGGGGRFALVPTTDEVLFLPVAAVDEHRVYKGGDATRIATSVDGLVSYLARKTESQAEV